MSAAQRRRPDAGPAPASVEFVGADGTSWRVTERDTAGEPGTRGPRCLVFMSDGVVRRAWEYPDAWWTLPPGELEALGARPPGRPDRRPP